MAAAAVELAPPGLPDALALMARARGENFPVALRLLAPAERRALLAVYGFARLADELGDELGGDRLAALDWLEREIDRAYRARCAGGVSEIAKQTTQAQPAAAQDQRSAPGAGAAGLLSALREVLAERELPREALLRLIEANRLDQRVSHYENWVQLRGYCHLSADPVGELVLAIFGARTPERVALSDRVCTGLQLTEHLQDFAEDLARGRVYLPGEDLDRSGCSREQPSGAPLRAAVAFEVARARELLWAGAPLAASLRGRARVAVAAFAGGGLAALERIERAGFEVSRGVPAAGRWARVRWTARVLRAAGGLPR